MFAGLGVQPFGEMRISAPVIILALPLDALQQRRSQEALLSFPALGTRFWVLSSWFSVAAPVSSAGPHISHNTKKRP